MKEEMEIYPIDMQNGLYGYNDITFKVCDQNNTPLDLTGVEIRVYVEDVDFIRIDLNKK